MYKGLEAQGLVGAGGVLCLLCIQYVCVCVVSSHARANTPRNMAVGQKAFFSPIATRHLTVAQADRVAGAKLGLVALVVLVVLVVVVVVVVVGVWR